VDNASGVLTALRVIDRLPPDARVGLLLPDGEEWGLLGARAVVRARATLLHGAAVINFDGIDDGGGTLALVHRPGPVAEALVTALGARRARWLPVVVDGAALAPAAAECVTIMRGDWDTMRIVHTPRDRPERLTLVGVEAVAECVAEVLRNIDSPATRS
jgi:Zn-dependent M28 family amino/carboxypeptidase